MGGVFDEEPRMIFDWQILAVLFVVAVAVAYVVRHLWRSVSAKSAGGCGSCDSSCASNSGAGDDSSQLVSLSEQGVRERK